MLFTYTSDGVLCISKKLNSVIFLNHDLELKILPKSYIDRMTVLGYAGGKYDGQLSSYIDEKELQKIFSFGLQTYSTRYSTIAYKTIEVRRAGFTLADKILLPVFKKICKMKGFL